MLTRATVKWLYLGDDKLSFFQGIIEGTNALSHLNTNPNPNPNLNPNSKPNPNPVRKCISA